MQWPPGGIARCSARATRCECSATAATAMAMPIFDETLVRFTTATPRRGS